MSLVASAPDQTATHDRGRLPNFIVGGAQKAGSTSIWHVLNRHPDVFMAPEKEVDFFWNRRRFDRGLEWYASRFQGVGRERLVGEASPSYMFRTWAAAAMHRLLPDAKLIFCLRNPIDRAYSQYWHSRRRLWETLPFEQAVLQPDSEYLRRGHYAEQIQRFFDHFPQEQILVVFFDRLEASPPHFYQTIFDFLGIPFHEYPEMYRRSNDASLPRGSFYRVVFENPHLFALICGRRKRSGLLRRLLKGNGTVPYVYPAIAPHVRASLTEYFHPHNEALSRLLGCDIPAWDA